MFFAVIRSDGSNLAKPADYAAAVSYCVSHEIVEMATNPDTINGWLTLSGTTKCEIGDMCECQSMAGCNGAQTVTYFGSWSVEKYWSNIDKDCFDPSTLPTPSTHVVQATPSSSGSGSSSGPHKKGPLFQVALPPKGT